MTGGHSSRVYFNDQDGAHIKEVIREFSPLATNKERAKVKFVNDMTLPYQNLSRAKVKTVLKKKKDLYDKKFGPAFSD